MTDKSKHAMSLADAIDILTDGEGDTVTFCCKNPDFNGLPNECVIVNASWTEWQDRAFRADTREECLSLAVRALREAAGLEMPQNGWKPASPSPPPSAGVDAVAVKALEWRALGGAFNTNTPFGRYAVLSNGYWLGPNHVDGSEETADEAKAAAQADYEARIRSALTPAPASGHNLVRETFAYYLANTEDGMCKIPRRVADDLLQSYVALEAKLAALTPAPTPVEAESDWECKSCDGQDIDCPECAAAISKGGIANSTPVAGGEAVAWRWRYPDGPWHVSLVNPNEGRYAHLEHRPLYDALAKPAPAVEAVREALETAVDAMQLYMLPSAMDGGIGECAAITNTKHALEKALAVLAPAAQAGTVAQEGRAMLTAEDIEGCKEMLREHWHSFCDADPVPDDFIEIMEAAGLVTIRKVKKADVENDPFAAERGIELGGWMWVLTDEGNAALATPAGGEEGR